LDKLPLDGIRVADFTAVWAGSHITQWLGVMGAEVIKIESNLRPDLTRQVFRGMSDECPMSAVFAVLNYGKKGCVLNMTNPKARELAKELIKMSDIVAENFGGPVMDRWGLGYSELKKVKPDIIMYAGSGFGRTGPDRERPAFAGIIEAFSGICAANAYPDGEPLPMATRGYSDLAAAEHGVFAILAALYHRSRTGQGQYIDLSMTEVMASLLPESIMQYTMNGTVDAPQGNGDRVMAPHGCYRCRGDDEWVAIAVSTDEEWDALCGAMGNPEWAKDESFHSGLRRLENREELDRRMQEWTREQDHRQVAETLQKAGVTAGPSCKVEEVVEDAHLAHRGFFVDIDHPGVGALRLAGLPWKLSNVPQGAYSHAPLLGQDNDYVFRELLKLSDEEIARLEEEQVIY